MRTKLESSRVVPLMYSAVQPWGHAEWAGLIEIHTHLHEDGVMKMRQINSLEIPGGESVVLEPGGLHLMLFKLQLPLTEPLPLTLCFDDGECQTASAELRSLK